MTSSATLVPAHTDSVHDSSVPYDSVLAYSMLGYSVLAYRVQAYSTQPYSILANSAPLYSMLWGARGGLLPFPIHCGVPHAILTVFQI
jgi:hypothetical protein